MSRDSQVALEIAGLSQKMPYRERYTQMGVPIIRSLFQTVSQSRRSPSALPVPRDRRFVCGAADGAAGNGRTGG